MLTVYSGENGYPIMNDDYYIRYLASGLDEIVFNVSIRDEVYQYITEENRIRDRDQNYYIIKQIDAGNEKAKVVAQIDIDDWKATMYQKYTNNSASVYETVLSVLPAGWGCIDHTGFINRRTIPTSDTTQDYNVTAWKVLQDCCTTYKVRFRFNTATKIVHIINPTSYRNVGAFATRDLNLKDLNFKGKSTDFCTRLYAEGADGLTFEDINDGKAYVEDFSYSNKVISAYWKDDRYKDAQSLLDDARAKLAENCKPQRSYDCDVLDLKNTNPEMYGFENFDLFSVITLIDDAKQERLEYQVVEKWDYPYYPVNNKVVLSTETPKIQSQVISLIDAVNSPTSAFQQIMQSAIINSTDLITGNNGGYVSLHDTNGDTIPDEILIMDTPDIATAQKVWRWNKSGLGYSNTGYNGQYGLAMTIDGSIVADYITTGALNGGLINAGSLQVSALSDDAMKEAGLLHSYAPIDLMSNLPRWEYNAETVSYSTTQYQGETYTTIELDGSAISAYDASYQAQFKSDYVGNPTITVKFKYKFDCDVTIARQRFNYFYYPTDDGNYTWWGWLSGSFEANRVYTYENTFAFTQKVTQSITPRIGFYFPAGCVTSIFDIEITGLQGDYMKSTLSVSADGLNSIVQKGDIISSINQSAEALTINASKIDLTGNVDLHGTFTSYRHNDDSVYTQLYEDGIRGFANGQRFVISSFSNSPAYYIEFTDPSSIYYGKMLTYIDSVLIRSEEATLNKLTVYNNSGLGEFTCFAQAKMYGTVYNNAGGVVFTSDKRKKKNIKNLVLDKAKTFIMALKPKEFKFKEGTSNRKHHGFIAQEVKEAMHEDWGLYVENKETDFIGLRYDEIIADLVAVVQDQEKRIEALEKALERKVTEE